MVSSMGVPLGSGISAKILSRKMAIRIFPGSGRSSTKKISSLAHRSTSQPHLITTTTYPSATQVNFPYQKFPDAKKPKGSATASNFDMKNMEISGNLTYNKIEGKKVTKKVNQNSSMTTRPISNMSNLYQYFFALSKNF
jgi:hypothetical protein